MKQQTIRIHKTISGIGIHSGKKTRMRCLPAPDNAGILFKRTDCGHIAVPALAHYAKESKMRTYLAHKGIGISTIEHFMAAVRALGIDNLIIELNSQELPILDGSAEPFIHFLQSCGLKNGQAQKRCIVVKKDIEVYGNDGSIASLTPGISPRYTFSIDFQNPAINRQDFSVDLSDDSFISLIAGARTFGFIEDLSHLRKNNLALGAGLNNTVVLNKKGGILNKGGLRFADEFVRHKVLDAIGDTLLAGYPIIGHYVGIKASHALNFKLVQSLLSNPSNYFIKELDESPQQDVA